jgi:hypothetical protein
MYLWNILQNSGEILVRKVCKAQKILPVKDDWVIDDFDFFGIPFDEIKIKNTKKIAMRKLLNDKIRDASHSSLLEDRKGKLCNLEADYQLK